MNRYLYRFTALLFAICIALSGCGIPEITSGYSDTEASATSTPEKDKNPNKRYRFRNPSYLTEHYKKHGIEMGFESEDEYLTAANEVIRNPEALHKLEEEDDDHVYYIEETNEIVFLSQDGYIRTYFICRGKDYFDRQ